MKIYSNYIENFEKNEQRNNMTQRALLIGINYVGQSGELKGCINDVLNMKTFIKGEGYKEENIRLMTEASNVQTDIPTAQNILSGFEWLCAGATAESELFLHYSGHGGSIRDRSSDEMDRKDETICPVDYSYRGQITDDLLREQLINRLPAGSKLTAIFDCCHSGTILDLKYNWVGHPRIPGAYQLIVDRPKETQAAVMAISGCRDEQYSADAYEEGQAQGAMTFAFLKTVRKHRRLGRRTNCRKLIKDMHKFLKVKGYTQTPQLSCGQRTELSDEFSPKKKRRIREASDQGN